MTTSSWTDWIGRTEQLKDTVTPVPLQLMTATVDSPWRSGDALPPLWHWLYFLQGAARSRIGADGHPQRGGFLPPVPLPRRMWAGGRLQFHKPLHEGQALTKLSRIEDISVKSGRSGELVFVKVVHEVSTGGQLAIREEHDIVYRDAPQPGSAVPAAKLARADHDYEREFTPDPVLLFRYSALTFNGHRIHYDRSYVTQEEGYPALVVHGPLIATLLLQQLQQEHPELDITAFDFRAVSPLFDNAPFWLCGRIEGDVAYLWARGPQGQLAMEAQALVRRKPGAAS